MIRKGCFPAVRIGRQTRVDRISLERWINEGGANTQECQK